MGFQGFKHSAEPKGRSRPMQLAKAFQVCPCCSVTPAHSPLALSTGRQALNLDLLVWHIRQGPGLGSLRSETQEVSEVSGPRGTAWLTQPEQNPV